uniref:Uncharacterized protein n=1 Tax=Magallana gigas TaxID=29159 RepID=K1Q7N2_MAGGI
MVWALEKTTVNWLGDKRWMQFSLGPTATHLHSQDHVKPKQRVQGNCVLKLLYPFLWGFIDGSSFSHLVKA